VASTPFQDKIKSSLNQSFENSDMMVDSLNSIICQAADILLEQTKKRSSNLRIPPIFVKKLLFLLKLPSETY
jgi:hypothetical protein